MSSDILLWPGLVLVATVAFWLLQRKPLQDDHNGQAIEPITIKPTIPYIGHVLGMLRSGSRYYAKISASCSAPIYCLPVPGGKIHIVKAPNLAKAVDRSSKSISFYPYVYEFSKRILNLTPEGLSAIRDNTDKAACQWEYCSEIMSVIHETMAPGDYLETMSQAFVTSACNLFDNGIWVKNSKKSSIQLFTSMRGVISQAGTDTIYGSEINPFHEAGIEADFWTFDSGFGLLGLNILPQVLAPRAYQARKRIFDAFQRYYAKEWRLHASPLIKARYALNQKHVSLYDIEHADLSICIGLLVNTVPATAWVLFHIYSNVNVLHDLREMCTALSSLESDLEGQQVRQLKISQVAKAYPLLEALIQETLRTQSTNAAGRVVLEDTILDNTYLLKKGSFLFVPSAELHSDASAWGSNHDQFDPQRFMSSYTGTKASHYVYRAFGGGINICPGKYLAVNEIITVAVLCVLKYNLTPVSKSWTMPERVPHMTTSILTPLTDIDIEITNWKSEKNCEWRFQWN